MSGSGEEIAPYTLRMRRQCVPGSLSPPPESEPGFEARTCALQTGVNYVQTKMSDQDSVELALIMKKKERKKERRKIDKWPIF